MATSVVLRTLSLNFALTIEKVLSALQESEKVLTWQDKQTRLDREHEDCRPSSDRRWQLVMALVSFGLAGILAIASFIARLLFKTPAPEILP
jgi:hypothetical protein